MFSTARDRPLTRTRIVLAVLIAAVTDALQLGLGPLGWTFLDEIADVAAMGLLIWLLGFHPLLLPTFLIELFPVVDMVPTWTGCVTAVLLLRKSGGKDAGPDKAASTSAADKGKAKPSGPIIDV